MVSIERDSKVICWFSFCQHNMCHSHLVAYLFLAEPPLKFCNGFSIYHDETIAPNNRPIFTKEVGMRSSPHRPF